MWMDHRAETQADRINNIKHEVLKYVGGKVSPGKHIPKMMWLKEVHCRYILFTCT